MKTLAGVQRDMTRIIRDLVDKRTRQKTCGVFGAVDRVMDRQLCWPAYRGEVPYQ